MGLYFEVYTLAQTALDANLAEGKKWQKSSRPRRISRIGFSGSADEADCGIDVYYGTEKIMHLHNTGLAAACWDVNNQFWHSSKLFCPAGTPINIIVTDAADTNGTYLAIDIADMVA